ncbi:MFS transporter [Amnibacterium kyonggiense]|uniref:MFS transporter n=1 Tax=Amnibacterium kyonggiense TaxID=595671 RepID=UPI00105ED735|nr:MFS transporter [Amnibacterium kyonggiense]
MPSPRSAVVRHLTVAQGLSVAGSTVDLTLTGIVGARIAPTPALATVPYSLVFLVAGLCTFGVSRAIGRLGHRRVFVAAPIAAAVSGCVSAAGVQLQQFWLFCVGTALIGVYQAGSGYYRYLAAESMPRERARAVSSVLAGGLVAALVGPFLATALGGLTSTPFVGSYLLVAVLGAAASAWNTRLVEPLAGGRVAVAVAVAPPRARRELWQQPGLIAGTAAALLAAGTMMAMMTAGPILGLATGRTPVEAAFGVQLHMIGMYAPGLVVARAMARVGERVVAIGGCVLVLAAGLTAATATSLAAYLAAMLLIGVGWNLGYGAGSAMITAHHRPAERGRVQPIAEALIIAAQVLASAFAVAFTSVTGWHALGWCCLAAAAVVAVVVLRARPGLIRAV